MAVKIALKAHETACQKAAGEKARFAAGRTRKRAEQG